ncbi:MAG: DUF6090 family protein [Eudoraea sp.]|uniref:DUF6090 family protein n=1 Tax=Eudoraea sp. TaxID=1979955 RepID=UPI003267359F
MINFFRRIRKKLADDNKPLKYARYAIGEILLVVIGILIALSINNWNEQRKDQIKEKATLYKFLQDLKSDSTYYQVNLGKILSIDSLHKELYLVGFKEKEVIEHSNPSYIRRSLVYDPLAKENDPNIANKINNDKIRGEIQIYFRSMSSVTEAEKEHESVVFKIRDFIRRHKMHDVQYWFDSRKLEASSGREAEKLINESNLVMLSKNEDFQQLLFESSLKSNEMKQTFTKLIGDNTRLITKIKKYLDDDD